MARLYIRVGRLSCQLVEEETPSAEQAKSVAVQLCQAVHEEYGSNFTNKHSIQSDLRRKQATESAVGFTQSLRSQNQRFNFARCLFCSNEADVNVSNGPKVHPVRTLDFLKTPFSKYVHSVEICGRTVSKVDLSLSMICKLLMLFIIKHAAFIFEAGNNCFQSPLPQTRIRKE